MFSNYGTAMGTLFKGILMLAACSGCYLVWWGVAFYPERHVPLWLSGILLVATAACGIMAVNRSVAAFHRTAALWGQGDCFYWFPSLNLCVIGLAV